MPCPSDLRSSMGMFLGCYYSRQSCFGSFTITSVSSEACTEERWWPEYHSCSVSSLTLFIRADWKWSWNSYKLSREDLTGREKRGLILTHRLKRGRRCGESHTYVDTLFYRVLQGLDFSCEVFVSRGTVFCVVSSGVRMAWDACKMLLVSICSFLNEIWGKT